MNRFIVAAALSVLALCLTSCDTLESQLGLSTAATGQPSQQIEVVSFTQVGNSLSVRLHNPNSDVGLVRSPFELAMLDQGGAVIGTAGQAGVPGAAVNTIYQLPPGGEYGLDTVSVPNGRTVASVELTVLGQWFKWDTVNQPRAAVTDAAVAPDSGHFGPSVTGRVSLDSGGPFNVVVVAFVKTQAGTIVSDVFVDCVQTGQSRTFQTGSRVDARGPYTLDKVVAYTTSIEGVGPRFEPNCPASANVPAQIGSTPASAPAPSPTKSAVPTVGKAQVARQISDDLFRQFGSRPDSVTCPEDLEGTPWATLRCELKDNGQTYGVTVTVNSVQGSDVNYGFKVDEQPNNTPAPSRPSTNPGQGNEVLYALPAQYMSSDGPVARGLDP